MSQEMNTSLNPVESKINSIQVLRGVAALIVTVYHLKGFIAIEQPFRRELDFLFDSGAAGVNLFFVISGFIMVYITEKTPGSPRDIYKFIVKRFIRIWPTYAVLTVVYFLARYRWYATAVEIKELAKSLLFIPLEYTPPPFYGYATLPVGWSLNYEIYFYALITASLLFRKLRWPVFFLLTVLTLVIIPVLNGSFTLDAARTENYGYKYLNMITNPIIWSFIYGVVIGLLYSNPKVRGLLTHFFSRKWIFNTVVMLAIWQYLSGFFGGQGALQWAIGASALFSAFLFYHAGRQTQFPDWMIRLGDISYSIYLLHVPVSFLITIVFQKLGYPIYSTGPAFFFLSTSLTLISASLSYEYLEIRLSNYLKRLFPLF
jgi:exopolysaccharide production protein ExoZ